MNVDLGAEHTYDIKSFVGTCMLQSYIRYLRAIISAILSAHRLWNSLRSLLSSPSRRRERKIWGKVL